MKLMTRGLEQTAMVPVGSVVPDFTLIDQRGTPVLLSDLKGKVVAVNFMYTRCALPNFCYRLSNNLGQLQNRFRPRLGKDLVLLTITFDPVHDRPEQLAHYAAKWKADARTWHFLTGPEKDVARVCEMFGVDAFPDEGLYAHSLHTLIIGRSGELEANLEGNKFTAAQLGDLVDAVLRQKP
jgi:protein SCO1/2